MSNEEIIWAVLIVIWAAALAIIFRKKLRNLGIAIAKRKSYVVVHMKHEGTGFWEHYNVVPDADKSTQIGKMNYTLHPQFAAFPWKGRLHYIVQEFDAVPTHYVVDGQENEDILFQAHEIQAALTNQVAEMLFRQRLLIYFVILAVVAGIGFVVVAYDIYQIQNIQKVIQALPIPVTEVKT